MNNLQTPDTTPKTANCSTLKRWEYSNAPDRFVGSVIDNSTGDTIAYMHPCLSIEQDHQYGKLLAAAPELLMALQEIADKAIWFASLKDYDPVTAAGYLEIEQIASNTLKTL